MYLLRLILHESGIGVSFSAPLARPLTLLTLADDPGGLDAATLVSAHFAGWQVDAGTEAPWYFYGNAT